MSEVNILCVKDLEQNKTYKLKNSPWQFMGFNNIFVEVKDSFNYISKEEISLYQIWEEDENGNKTSIWNEGISRIFNVNSGWANDVTFSSREGNIWESLRETLHGIENREDKSYSFFQMNIIPYIDFGQNRPSYFDENILEDLAS